MGFNNMGFILTSGAILAPNACTACACAIILFVLLMRKIKDDMFCDLNGATL
jgi:hypothetical protein